MTYLKAARPADLEDTPFVPCTGRHLPKRKLMYGRMVIDLKVTLRLNKLQNFSFLILAIEHLLFGLHLNAISKMLNLLHLHFLVHCLQAFELLLKLVRFRFLKKSLKSVIVLLMHVLTC